MISKNMKKAIEAKIKVGELYMDADHPGQWYCPLNETVEEDGFSFFVNRVNIHDEKLIEKQNIKMENALNKIMEKIHLYVQSLLNSESLKRERIQPLPLIEFPEVGQIMDVLNSDSNVEFAFEKNSHRTPVSQMIFGRSYGKPVEVNHTMCNLWINCTFAAQENSSNICFTIDIMVSRTNCNPQHMQLYRPSATASKLKLLRFDVFN